MCFRPALPALLLVAMSAPARADIVHLKNGKTLEGSVAEGAKKGTVEIRTGEGTVISLSEADIEKIEKKASPLEELDARMKGLPPGELEPLSELLVWARDKQLSGKVKTLARRILEIDPNNELARKELGYVVFGNRWMLESELKKKKGLVRYRDEWMTQAEKDQRVAGELKTEMEDLLSLVNSENPHIQEFAFHKLLSLKEPAARDVFGEHLGDSREAVRWVAVRGLAGFPVKGEGDAAAKAIAASLHRLAVDESSDKGLQVIFYTLKRFFPAESARLAAEAARVTSDGPAKRRAAEIAAKLKPE